MIPKSRTLSKRLHIHVRADDIVKTRAFYVALFGQEPDVDEPDYLKWQLDDPRVNFAVGNRCDAPSGIEHVGIEVDDEADLQHMYAALTAAGIPSTPETGTHCCYANSNKHWTSDPQGVAWEFFHTMGKAQTYGNKGLKLGQEANGRHKSVRTA